MLKASAVRGATRVAPSKTGNLDRGDAMLQWLSNAGVFFEAGALPISAWI
jgi:hypothetical protein